MSLLKAFQGQLTSFLKDSDTFAIGYHPDADGMGAVAILIRYLLEQGRQREDIFLYPTNASSPMNRLLYPEQEADVLSKHPDIFLYVDLANYIPDQIRRIKAQVKHVVSIDHHNFRPRWPYEFDLYINPLLFKDIDHPNSLASARLMSLLLDMDDCDWLSLLGFTGDNVIETIESTLFYDITEFLNLMGTVEHPTISRHIQSQRTNTILDLLTHSSSLDEFKHQLDAQQEIMDLYHLILKDAHETISSVSQAAPYATLGDHALFYCPYSSRSGYDIGGLVLKTHIAKLKYQQTVVLAQKLGPEEYHFYLYTTDPCVNCYQISIVNGGGGHINKGGFTYFGKDVGVKFEEIFLQMKEMLYRFV